MTEPSRERPETQYDDGEDPPGGPWASWPSIYATLAVWGVACILFLIWVTSTLNVDVGEETMDIEVAEAVR